jgi:hypothetical protein
MEAQKTHDHGQDVASTNGQVSPFWLSLLCLSQTQKGARPIFKLHVIRTRSTPQPDRKHWILFGKPSIA